jgi:hypothetical protein
VGEVGFNRYLSYRGGGFNRYLLYKGGGFLYLCVPDDITTGWGALPQVLSAFTHTPFSLSHSRNLLFAFRLGSLYVIERNRV